MNNIDMLATFKKYVESEHSKSMTKSQIHRFSENIKGINEFIGASQIILLNISKIKKIVEKIECLDEFDSKSSIKGYMNDINHIVDNTVFMGIKLFDTELSCNFNGVFFSLNVTNPLNFSDDIYGYCIEMQDKISNTISSLSAVLTMDSDDIDYNISLNTGSNIFKNY